MHMKRILDMFGKRVAATLATFLFAAALQAEPILQIDLTGGFYVGDGDIINTTDDEDSVVTNDTIFDLYALGTPGGRVGVGELLETIYWLSVAVIPMIGPDPVDFGSFVVDGTTYGVDDMSFGTPPLDAYFGDPEAGLASHGIFDTFFLELAVTFTGTNTAETYNVQGAAGTILSNLGGAGSFYDVFSFDVSGLNEGFDLHFDLYDAVVANGPRGSDGDEGVGVFAPFSHDARTNCCTTVPEPGTLALFAIGLIGLGSIKRRAISVRS